MSSREWGSNRPSARPQRTTQQAPLFGYSSIAGRGCRGRGGVSQSKQAAGGPPRSDKWESRNGTSCSVSFGPLHVSLFAMSTRCFLLLLWAVSAQADFFHFDSISNVSTYYFNYIYCNIWEGECQPNQDDATQQGKRW